MTFQQRLMIITALAVVLAVAVLTRKPVSTPSSARLTSGFGGLVAAWLAVVAGALIVVGIVSQTLLRHFIQIAPLIVALSLLPRRSAWGVSAAAPLFAFWFLIMGAIWLFLLGVARIVTGTFTPAEVMLTVIIGVASLFGLGTVYRRGTTIPILARLGTIAAFAVLQFAAMWFSVQPFVARR
jgi:hypothetical protein